MEAYISQKPPLPTTSSISASTPSPSPSNIKIERVLNSSSASIEPFLQPSVARRPSLVSPPSSLPTLTTLPLSESPAGTSKQLQQYHQHQPQPLLSSTSPERSMAAAAVATQPAHVMQPFTRPIRFVANDGQPHAKRRRISAAYVTSRPAIPHLKLGRNFFLERKNGTRKRKLLHSFLFLCLLYFQSTPPPHITPRPCSCGG